MNAAPSEFDPIDDLVESYLARYRRGEQPSIAEYADRYPELAERIRDVIPALLVMEEIGSEGGHATDIHANPTGPEDAIPERLGDFILIRCLGSGGMGIVYEAIQESLGRHVALKTLPHDHLRDATRLERFRREARAAARLHHTHIVPVYGVGQHDGVHYYTMQFIRGHGLDAVLQEVKRLRRDPSTSESIDPPDGQVASSFLACGLRSGSFPAGGADAD